ncbi:MAG: hypothetical protein WBD45_02400 [Terriglobales bacterium]
MAALDRGVQKRKSDAAKPTITHEVVREFIDDLTIGLREGPRRRRAELIVMAMVVAPIVVMPIRVIPIIAMAIVLIQVVIVIQSNDVGIIVT